MNQNTIQDSRSDRKLHFLQRKQLFNKVLSIMYLFTTMALPPTLATTTVDVKFNAEQTTIHSRGGVLKIVKINDLSDLPGQQNALHLQTLIKNGKPSYVSWTYRFKPIQQQRVTVDFQIKLDADASYALFVRDKGLLMVATMFRKGRLRSNNGGKWTNGPKVPVGRWLRMRYVIKQDIKRYDVYLENMQKPVFSNFKYRNAKVRTASNVWIGSSESAASTTLITGIKLTGSQQKFPSASMAKPPFCVATVRRSGPITLDGRGDESAWSQAVPLYFSRGDWLPTAEKANVKLLWDSRYLYALFTGMAVKPSLRAKEVSGNDVRVWRKDCFELFIDPGRTQRNYLHFAANAAQGKYDSRHAPGKRDTSYESGWRIRAVIDSDHWTAEAAIPFSALGGTPQPGAVWGFNAGRENSYTEEVSSWSPLDTFHQPRRFGVLLFVTSAYLRQQPLDAGARIARIMYPSHQLEAEADAALKVARAKLDAVPNFSDRVNQAAKQLSTLQHQLANARFFIVYFNAFEQLRDFVAEMSKLKVELIRYAAMFTPGSSGARNGYVASVENSMTKVLPNAYICSGKTQTTLELARNEVGGFQIPLTFQPGYRPKCVTVSVSDLTGTSKAIIPAAAVKSYKVGTIKTAFPRSSHQEELVPDVLFPGHEFAYLDPAPIETLWIDVKVPATAAAGTYHGTITVRPDSKPATSITMRLKVRNFTLPRNSSLKNVFCFRPSQAEIYYGKKMPKWARHNYFDFVIAHRLEPLNLWHRNTKERMLYMSEAELKDYLQRGKNLILVKIPSTKKAFMQWSAPALAMLKRNGWLDKAIMFGFDEVLFHPKRIPEMKKMFAFAKQQASGVPRMITAKIDPILFGVVDIWCPLFNDFDAAEARAREAKGEQVWWYLTDNYPSKPFASLNLDSPGIDPRIIPWMNWKLQITGLLYWNMTSEWKLNGGQQKMIPSKVVKDRGLTWLTPQVAAQVGKSLRWPQIPWIPFFQNIFSKRYTRTNGGGNLMYPGPNWQPLSSIRLKNLRDGMQDYEYFAILQRNLTQLHQHGGDPQLIQQAQAALSLNGKAVQSATSYTKDPTVLLKAKHDIAELIEKTANALQNP